jgi:hypothetical protein
VIKSRLRYIGHAVSVPLFSKAEAKASSDCIDNFLYGSLAEDRREAADTGI